MAVLVALIVVHELGHFAVAKWSGMRVDEFGLGYPPKLAGWKRGETEYTLNALPFGGFVKIFGEDLESDGLASPRAFSSRPRILQGATLVAGIVMNLLFAYLLITIALALGTTRVLEGDEVARASNASLAIASVLPGSPADKAGLAPGEIILEIQGVGGSYASAGAEGFTAFVGEHQEDSLLLLTLKNANGTVRDVSLEPAPGLIPGDPERRALGVGLATIGVIKEPLLHAPVAGLGYAVEAVKETAVGLFRFFADVFTFHADLSQVSGPVGIAGAVGDASHAGLASLLSITAIISINLALINLLPIPALDGGRLLFVIIEAITRRPIKPVVANVVNTAGFGFLILLMLVITAHDVLKLFA
jgi:regulator of sigma E protease